MATPILLPRGVLPPDYGERLRAAGLNEGISFGGSEIDPRDELTPEQQARLLALASGGGGPTFTNADIANFIAQRNGGTLPGLENVGGDAGAAPNSATPDGTSFNAPDLSGISLPAGTGRAAGSILGGTFGGLLGGMIPGAGVVLGPAGALVGGRLGGNLGATIEGALRDGPGTLITSENQIPMPEDPNALATPAPEFTAHDLAVANSLGITDPATQGFRDSSSRTGYRDVTGKELTPPGAPPLPPEDPNIPKDEGLRDEPPDNSPPGPPGPGPDPGNDPGDAGPAGGGTGAGGGSAAGPSGDASDAEARGGVITRRPRNPVNVRGGWKGVKTYQAGGGVAPTLYRPGGPVESERQARARRVAEFERRFGSVRV